MNAYPRKYSDIIKKRLGSVLATSEAGPFVIPAFWLPQSGFVHLAARLRLTTGGLAAEKR